MLLPVTAALVLLFTTPGGALGGEVGDDMEIDFGTEASGFAAVLLLVRNVLEHLCVPHLKNMFLSFCFVHVLVSVFFFKQNTILSQRGARTPKQTSPGAFNHGTRPYGSRR